MPDASLSPRAIASRIDHTLLKPEADAAAIDAVCDEAIAHGFASVCVNGCHLVRVVKRLAGTPVKACAVAGFPLGAMASAMKAAEAAALCEAGADEVDFVANLSMLMHDERSALVDEWSAVVDGAKHANPAVVVKVILETAAVLAGLDGGAVERRVAMACGAARAAGVGFVKTSTGFHAAGGATVEHVSLMRKHGSGLLVKASGGIRTYADAAAMLAAGADRLGCSSGVAIVTGATSKGTSGGGSY